MKILVTAFDPFNKEKVNPSTLVLEELKDTINTHKIIKLIIPTIFNQSTDLVIKTIKKEKPDIVISLGQSGGRTRISLERVAININDARISDNSGFKPIDEVIEKDGDVAYFSTLPLRKMEKALLENEIPVEISNSAGTFVCNHVFYGVRHFIEKEELDILSGFIHIPYLPNQVLDKKNEASMALETLVKGIELAISSL